MNYRISLVERIGNEALEWLEGPHEPKHYTISDLKAVKSKYVNKLRALKNEQG